MSNNRRAGGSLRLHASGAQSERPGRLLDLVCYPGRRSLPASSCWVLQLHRRRQSLRFLSWASSAEHSFSLRCFLRELFGLEFRRPENPTAFQSPIPPLINFLHFYGQTLAVYELIFYIVKLN